MQSWRTLNISNSVTISKEIFGFSEFTTETIILYNSGKGVGR